MHESKRPTIIRIIDSDYTAALALMAPFIIWLLFWLLLIMHVVDLQILRYLAIVLTIASLLLVAWRCWLISKIFANGVETAGEVKHIWFYRDRGRLMVTFNSEGKVVEKDFTIPKNEYTQSLTEGQPVMLVVDRDQLKHVFVRDLYLPPRK